MRPTTLARSQTNNPGRIARQRPKGGLFIPHNVGGLALDTKSAGTRQILAGAHPDGPPAEGFKSPQHAGKAAGSPAGALFPGAAATVPTSFRAVGEVPTTILKLCFAAAVTAMNG